MTLASPDLGSTAFLIVMAIAGLVITVIST